MQHTLVMAGSRREFAQYCQAEGLSRREATFATPQSCVGIRPTRIVELPGFAKAPNRHAVAAAVRVARRKGNGVEVERIEEMPEEAPEIVGPQPPPGEPYPEVIVSPAAQPDAEAAFYEGMD